MRKPNQSVAISKSLAKNRTISVFDQRSAHVALILINGQNCRLTIFEF